MMYQRLGDAFARPKHSHRYYRSLGWKLGIRVGKVYTLDTSRGKMIVEVVALHQKFVAVKEVEDTPQFKVNPLYLNEF